MPEAGQQGILFEEFSVLKLTGSPDGAGNGNLPIIAETNRIPPATGSGHRPLHSSTQTSS